MIATRPRKPFSARDTSLGLKGNRRLPTGARVIIERGHRGLQPRRARRRAGPSDEVPESGPPQRTGVFPIGQQYPRPLDPARRLRSRLGYRPQLRRTHIAGDNSIARRHAAMILHPAPLWEPENQDESPADDNFHGIDRLVIRCPQYLALS
jgi:hypothetical protein